MACVQVYRSLDLFSTIQLTVKCKIVSIWLGLHVIWLFGFSLLVFLSWPKCCFQHRRTFTHCIRKLLQLSWTVFMDLNQVEMAYTWGLLVRKLFKWSVRIITWVFFLFKTSFFVNLCIKRISPFFLFVNWLIVEIALSAFWCVLLA